MIFYEIAYYRTRNWIDKRYVKTDCGDPLNKLKIKNVVEVTEITEEQYKKYSTERKEREARRKEYAHRFIIAERRTHEKEC